LPENIPTIFVPFFAWSFVETDRDPALLLKKNDENISKNKFCCFAYSNCDENFPGVVARKRFLEIMNKMTGNKVDNLGKCYNTKYKENGTWKNGEELYKPYKFVISFENTRLKGYVTEKLINPMLARAIPIYFGAPDVDLYFNKKSFIDVNDFPSFEKCIEHVLKVDNNEKLYREIMDQPYLPENKIDHDLFSIYYGGKFYRDLQQALVPYGLDRFVRKEKILSELFRT